MADPYYEDKFLTIYGGDCREVLTTMPEKSVHCVVTSPPYWGLRDYGVTGQLGLEPTPEEYVANMVAVFREVRRVLRDDGTVWLNLGDSYAGARSEGGGTMAGFNDRYFGRETDGGKQTMADTSKPARAPAPGLKSKDLVGIPWMIAFALRSDGWYLRSDIIWSKPNPMPESVTDRPTKAHEYVFLLSKSARYFYDAEAVREPVMQSTIDRSDYGFRAYDERDTASRPTEAIARKALGLRAQAATDTVNRSIVNGRNLRSVWTIATQPYPGAHFATFPRKLVEPCVKAGCPEGGTVLDPFAGSGTTLLVAQSLGRRGIGIDLSPEYLEMAVRRGSREFGRGKVTDLQAKPPNEGLWALDE